MNFISIRFLDLIDIFLVAFLLYQLYMLIRGTVAIRIFIGIISIYIFWIIVKAVNMELLGSILGKIIGVGMIAMIIVFQQEIRRFLLIIGNQNFINQNLPFVKYFQKSTTINKSKVETIAAACDYMSKNYIGALIVISKGSELRTHTSSGEMINADISERLICNIFHKNTPLHDGAIIIVKDKIKAAGCILPVSNSPDLPKDLGLRHRAGLGMTERTDSVVVIVSEQSGNISVTKEGKLYSVNSKERLIKFLLKEIG